MKSVFSWFSPGEDPEKNWSLRFREIEKLVRKKNLPELEAKLDSAVSWTESCPPENILPEWLNQAGMLYQAYTGNFARAEDCFRKALEYSGLRENRREKALAMTNLGVLYLDQNRSAEAVDVFSSLKPLIEDHFGPESREMATVCQNLAAAFRLDGNEEDARQERIRATGILRKLS